MDIAAMNTRITFEKQTIQTDEYRNHTLRYEPYFTCWATVSAAGRQETESDEAGTTNVHDTIDFTIRWCRKAAAITSDGFSVRAFGSLYNIRSIDPMGNKHNSLKFHCEKVKR